MKKLLALSLLLSTTALAHVNTIKGRVFTGLVNPQISPFGAIVDLEKGEVLYVSSIVSVLAPKDLDKSCVYEFNFIQDQATPYKTIKLLPPTNVIICGQDFPGDR